MTSITESLFKLQSILSFTSELKDILDESYEEAVIKINSAIRSADEMLLEELRMIKNMSGYSNISELIKLNQETIRKIRDSTSGIANALNFANKYNTPIYKIYSHCFTKNYVSASEELMTIRYDLEA